MARSPTTMDTTTGAAIPATVTVWRAVRDGTTYMHRPTITGTAAIPATTGATATGTTVIGTTAIRPPVAPTAATVTGRTATWIRPATAASTAAAGCTGTNDQASTRREAARTRIDFRLSPPTATPTSRPVTSTPRRSR